MRSFARPSPLYRTLRPSTRTFTIASRLQIKEDAQRSPEELDRKKHEQLDEQKRGEGRWREDLASSGEAAVKHDNHNEIKDHDDHMEDLQKQTAEQSEKDHPHGKAEH